MPLDFILIKIIPSLIDYSSDSSSDFSSFVLNTLPLYEKIPFSKKPIISLLASNNFIADSKTLFSSSFFITFCFLIVMEAQKY